MRHDQDPTTIAGLRHFASIGQTMPLNGRLIDLIGIRHWPLKDRHQGYRKYRRAFQLSPHIGRIQPKRLLSRLSKILHSP